MLKKRPRGLRQVFVYSIQNVKTNAFEKGFF